MSITIPAVASNVAFQIWIDTTNQLANVISTIVVTVNSHANGGLTTGNGFVEGTFGARNLVGNTIHGGSVQTSGNLTLTSNLTVTGSTITVGNVAINSSGIAINGTSIIVGSGALTINTSGTSAQVIDFFDKFVYRGSEYVLSIKDNNANAYQISKLVLIHDSGEAYVTEYASVFSNTTQGEFTANANSTHVKIYLTPVSTNTYITGIRTPVNI